MKKAIGPGGLAILLFSFTLLSISSPSSGQQPSGKPTIDEKLDRILDRLEKIEKRISILELPAPRAATAPKIKSLAPSANGRVATSNRLPDIAAKPTPHSTLYKSCDPHGDNEGDQDLNFLKNRIDEADEWIEVDFDAVLGQAFPDKLQKKRAEWPSEDLAAVKRNEGLPISIVCYFAWAKDEGPESCNCHIQDISMFDIHTWLTKEPARIAGTKAPDRSRAIVAEVTPRLKPQHPQWTQAKIRQLAKAGKQVRVSGWLLFDQEHYDQLTSTPTQQATRGTLWEIHPIMEIEVQQNGEWVSLDDLAGN